MANRVQLTDRRGVNAFENFALNTLNWIFREQSIVDLGIDAHIEQATNGDSTGKLIAVQIKTGLSNVKINQNKDFDYYMSRVHYNYWLSYAIPVIIVLYDPEKKILYWTPIFKRNISKTKKDNHKVTIKKTSICAQDTISEFNEIIALYESKSFIRDMGYLIDKEEVGNYLSELFLRCSESLQKIREYIDQLDLDYKRGTKQMQDFIDVNKHGYTKEAANREIKKASCIFTLALNACRTRINNEIPLMVNVFIETFRYIELYLLPEIKNPEFLIINNYISKELLAQKGTIDSLIKTTNTVVDHYAKSTGKTLELGQAEIMFGKVVEDYKNELVDLSGLLQATIERININKI